MSDVNPYEPPESGAVSALPTAANGFIAGGRAVDAGRGWEWIVEGWQLFARQPLPWIVDGFILSLVVVVLPYVPPVLGLIASLLLTPVILGGLMLGAQAVEQGQPLTFGHLFAGFQKNTATLFCAGLIWFACLVAISLIAGLLIGVGVITTALAAMATGDFAQILTIVMGAIVTIFLGLSVALALWVPVAMMFWFAPALVVMHDMGIGAALKTSFTACLKNVVPFLLYGIVMLGLSVIATIPAGLGLLVLVPVTVASIYTAYRDIFFTA